jgi:hypothetical protein
MSGVQEKAVEDEIPTDEAVIASWQQTADYWAARAKRAEAENERLRSEAHWQAEQAAEGDQ